MTNTIWKEVRPLPRKDVVNMLVPSDPKYSSRFHAKFGICLQPKVHSYTLDAILTATMVVGAVVWWVLSQLPSLLPKVCLCNSLNFLQPSEGLELS